MSEGFNQAIRTLQAVMEEEGVDPTKGLPKELFHFATTLMPCPNNDLFITDSQHRLLLTWRDDKYYGQGWHIPGGCLRMRETLDKRIKETARNEIGTEVIYDPDSFFTGVGLFKMERPKLENKLERSHNFSMMFDCRLPDSFNVVNKVADEHIAGYL